MTDIFKAQHPRYPDRVIVTGCIGPTPRGTASPVVAGSITPMMRGSAPIDSWTWSWAGPDGDSER
jgi:hypothetical protein